MPKSTSVQNLKFQINQKESPHLQIWPLGQALPHSFGGILSSALPYPLGEGRAQEDGRKGGRMKHGKEGKYRRTSVLYTWGEEGIASGNWGW